MFKKDSITLLMHRVSSTSPPCPNKTNTKKNIKNMIVYNVDLGQNITADCQLAVKLYLLTYF